MSKDFYVAVDFDGTIAEHRFPKIGDEVPWAFYYLREFLAMKAKLILWTVRNDGRGGEMDKVLTEAVDFCRYRGVEFFGINHNPAQFSWSQSNKAYAHVYIDDAAFGCPLIHPDSGERPYANWTKIGPTVLEMIRGHS